jgi:aspartyl-tRNA(Asn)/glutamyl-tRNA(Gln) amidotransferase subunit B
MSQAPLVRGFEVVIGLETHAQLSTASKIFSGASTRFGAAPNTQACAVDLALPGTLPVLNRGAVERAIVFGLAVQATVAPVSVFARKNYFYPDLPKGYQISQYEIPVVQGGQVEFLLEGQPRRVRLTRAHLEEDAGKSLHEDYHGMSGIDLNRAGTPLLEIVSEPDMRSSAEAVEYARALHALVVWLGICDGNMQEGSFRCDANVSVRRPGAPFGTRREIKNLNSFRFLKEAIDFEVQWQIDRLEDGLSIAQATVLFDPDSGETRTMRTKEDAHDYRYFPDPDLPPLVIGPQWVARVRQAMPELPAAMAERFQRDDGLPAYDAAMMTQSLPFARYYEALRDACLALPGGAREAAAWAKLAANWLMGEVAKRLNAQGLSIETCPVPATVLAALIGRVADGTVSNSGARQVFEALWTAGDAGAQEGAAPAGARVDRLIEQMGLRQMSDTGALEALVDQVLAAHPKSVEEFKAGKDKAFNALVGQVMKASQGKANPAQAGEILRRRLAQP